MKHEIYKDEQNGEIVETTRFFPCRHNLDVDCERRKTLTGGFIVCGDIFGKIGTRCPIDDAIDDICKTSGPAYIPEKYKKFIKE